MSSDDSHDLYRTVAQLASGQRFLQRYSLTRILGRGGFGVVWLAHDDELQMDVAIKFLSDMIVNNPEAIDDLKRETRYSLRLTHPNIVRIYGFLQGPDLAGVSMEYVDGGTLSALKVDRPNRCFEVDDLAPLVSKLCDALYYAHIRVKVAHRDLKPGNLMVDSSGDLKVADFGISRSISDTQTALTQMAASGTPAYMSPQQMMGERSQVTDDIYSLGATLYDLLAGKPPFYQGNVVEQVRASHPLSIAARRTELGIVGAPIPPHWETVLGACLEKRAEDRPQSAAEVAERLGFHVNTHWREASSFGAPRSSGEAGFATPTSRVTPPDNRLVTPAPAPVSSTRSTSGKRRWIGLAAIALIVVAGVGGWQVLNHGSDPTESGEFRSDLSAQRPDDRAGAESGESPAAGHDPRGRVGPSGDEQVSAASPGMNSAESSTSASQGRSGGSGSGGDVLAEGVSSTRTHDDSSAPGSDRDPEAAPQTSPATQAPASTGIVRALESALEREEWETAERQLALLESTAPEVRTDGFARRIEDGRRVSVAESRIPTLIEAGDFTGAESELQAFERIRPDDPRSSRWRNQLAEMRTLREGPARERRELRSLVTEFHDSFSNLDLDRFAAFFVDPGRTRDEYERAFRDLASQTISLVGEPSIDLQGNLATVRLRDHRRQVMKIGRTFESDFDVVLSLEKHEGRWKIRSAETKLLP